MPSFRSLLGLSLLAVSRLASAAAIPCESITPGSWLIESAAASEQLLNVGGAFGDSNVITLASALDSQQAPTAVWTISAADQGGFSIMNSELGRNVSTIHLVESDLFLPLIATTGTPATTYAIECAGNNQYVIKNITADQLFTVVNNTDGVSTIELLPSDGSAEQMYIFHPL